MKKYTKKFLKGNSIGNEITRNGIAYNARRAKKKLGIPEKLWLELSEEIPKSKMCEKLKDSNVSTTFMAGFVIGWVEKGRKIK